MEVISAVKKHPVLLNLILSKVDISRVKLNKLNSYERDFPQPKRYDLLNNVYKFLSPHFIIKH